MIIETEIKKVPIEKLEEKRDNCINGIYLYEKELEEINKITDEELIEAERIFELLLKLKIHKKKESKEKGLNNQREKLVELNKIIKNYSVINL